MELLLSRNMAAPSRGKDNNELVLQMAVILAGLEISHSRRRLFFLELMKLESSRNEQKRT
jgi:hypothetical protein